MKDTEGFEAYFSTAASIARQAAGRVLGAQGDVENIAAETLVRLLSRWQRVGSTDYRNAWVARVAVNLSIDELRRMRRAAGAWRGSDSSDAIPDLDLRGAVARLPRRQRQAVALHYYADLTDPEVARSLGISVNTVKKHRQRGLKALAGELSETQETAG